MHTIGEINNTLKVIVNERECVRRQFDGICNNQRDCANCDLALKSGEILKAYDTVIEILTAMKPKIKVKRETKITVSRNWGMTMNVARQVAFEALREMGLEDHDIVHIHIRADIVVGGIVAEITERVEDTVRSYTYVSKRFGWRFN